MEKYLNRHRASNGEFFEGDGRLNILRIHMQFWINKFQILRVPLVHTHSPIHTQVRVSGYQTASFCSLANKSLFLRKPWVFYFISDEVEDLPHLSFMIFGLVVGAPVPPHLCLLFPLRPLICFCPDLRPSFLASLQLHSSAFPTHLTTLTDTNSGLSWTPLEDVN